MKYHFLAILLLACSFPASAEKSIIVNENGSPLRIENYSAAYNLGAGRFSREGIDHKVSVSNASDQTIVAYTVSFVAFDAFNEDMGRALGGVSIKDLTVGASTSGTWTQSAYAAFAFERHGTGVAYVSKVRLSDGTIWRANQDFILSELRKIRSDLTADIFENPKPNDTNG